jgi:hypothetical protein
MTMRTAFLAGAGAVAAGMLAATTVAAAVPLYPPSKSTISTSHPTFRWQLAPTEVAESVSVSTSPAIGLSGDFAKLTIVGILHGDKHSWTSTQPLFAGKYWWHLAFQDGVHGVAGGRLFFSPATPFTVKAVITLSSLGLHEAGNGVFAALTFKANVRTVNVSEKLFAGSKLIASRRSATDNILIDNPTRDQALLIVPSTVRHGAPLKLVVALSIAGSTTTLTKTTTFRAA